MIHRCARLSQENGDMHTRSCFLALSTLLAAACHPPTDRPADHLELAPAHGSQGDPNEDNPLAEPSPAVPIVGGHRVVECGWPSTVALVSDTSLCTGTLLHPSLVLYAAHCGAAFKEARFGESITGSGLQRTVPIETCHVLPGGAPSHGDDFAYCVLADPVEDVPIVPPLMGCELEVLEPGAPITLVGFGRTEDGSSGTKHEVDTEVVGFTSAGEIRLGGAGADTCFGDSGGPAFVQLDDGSWRVFGVTSWGTVCGQGGYSSLTSAAIPWVEAETGFDLSPCHDGYGVWEPGLSCDAFALEPWVGHGQWPEGCVGGPVSGPSETCGAPFPSDPEGSDPDCAGWCGGQAPAGCWCDPACVEEGDCCPDRAQTCAATCEGWCGVEAPGGCWCDHECTDYDDCCPDLELACS